MCGLCECRTEAPSDTVGGIAPVDGAQNLDLLGFPRTGAGNLQYVKQRTILVLGLALILLGAGGLLLVPILGGQFTVPDGFPSNGQRIYYTGVSASGPISRVGVGSGMMSGRVCVDCHGEDGHGGSLGMMNRVVGPDLR